MQGPISGGEVLNGSETLVTYDVFVNGVWRMEFWNVMSTRTRRSGVIVVSHRKENEHDMQNVQYH